MAKVEVDLSRATRLLEPGPIVLLTARHKDKANVMVAAWVAPASSDPPMVTVAIAPTRFTHDLVRKSGQFALNIPPRPLLDRVIKCGETTGADGDKFALLEFALDEGRQVNAPLIVECIGHLECGVVEALEVGNHTLFVGEVVAASADDSAFDGEHWTLADETVKPLHHLGGRRFALLDKVIEG